MKRLLKSDAVDTEFASDTNSSSVSLEEGRGYSAVAVITVTTPGAQAVAAAAVDATANTFTKASHGMKTGLKGQMTTTGGLPTGLSGGTDYWVIRVDANTFKLAASLSDALAGTAVDITTVGTGTHTFTPTALAGASVKIQGSFDGTNWADVSSTTSITTAANILWNYDGVHYNYARAVYVMTAGQLTVTHTFQVKG
jgi:hypothetical protein